MSKTTAKSTPKTKRVLKGETTIFHDLYRLEIGITKKNVSFTKHKILEPVPHKHWYHNIDTDGKKQQYCCPTAGHFHEIITSKDADGNLVAECGPALKFQMVRDELGRQRRAAVECPDHEKHTHEVTYMQSEELTKRVFNEEAVKVISAVQSREAAMMVNPTA